MKQTFSIKIVSDYTIAKEQFYMLSRCLETREYRWLVHWAIRHKGIDSTFVQYLCGTRTLTPEQLFSYVSVYKVPVEDPLPEIRPIQGAFQNPYKPINMLDQVRYQTFTPQQLDNMPQEWGPFTRIENVSRIFLHYLAIGSIPFFLWCCQVVSTSSESPLTYTHLPIEKMLKQELFTLQDLDYLFQVWSQVALNRSCRYNDLTRTLHPWESEEQEVRHYPGVSFQRILEIYRIPKARIKSHRVFRINWQLGDLPL